MKQYTINCQTRRMFDEVQKLIEDNNGYGNLIEGDVVFLRVFYDEEYFKLAITQKFFDKNIKGLFGFSKSKLGNNQTAY